MENLKTIPVTHSFVLNIEVSNETLKFQNDPELLDFLRKMNIENAFKLMPGKPIKLNIPILLRQPEDKKRKLKSTTTTTTSEKTKGKTPTKGSLFDQHEDEEEYARKRSTKESKETFYFNNKPEFIKKGLVYIINQEGLQKEKIRYSQKVSIFLCLFNWLRRLVSDISPEKLVPYIKKFQVC